MSKKNLTVRIDKDLLEKFIKLATNNESDASKEVRKFIKKYVKEGK